MEHDSKILKPLLEVQNVTKTFQEGSVLNHCSLKLYPQEIVGIVGKSGSGKSTLLRCIQGLETIDSGHIDCHGPKGFLFQDFQLFPHMTVMENLIYTPVYVHKLNKDEAKRRAYHFLEQLSIHQKALNYPGSLSGGQKQRVALARTLMINPKLLMCDEPTSGLDYDAVKEVMNLLKEVQTLGISMLIVSHDLTFLTTICNAIFILKQGIISKRYEHPFNIDDLQKSI